MVRQTGHAGRLRDGPAGEHRCVVRQCNGMRVVGAGVVRPSPFGLKPLEVGGTAVIDERLHVVGSQSVDADMNDEIGRRSEGNEAQTNQRNRQRIQTGQVTGWRERTRRFGTLIRARRQLSVSKWPGSIGEKIAKDSTLACFRPDYNTEQQPGPSPRRVAPGPISCSFWM